MTCRGCAGTGVGQHVGVREAQVALLPFKMKRSGSAASTMVLRVDAYEHRERLNYRAPLALILQEVRTRIDAGWWMVPRDQPDLSPPLVERWRCSWCHGTGQLQLSVASMEQAVGANA